MSTHDKDLLTYRNGTVEDLQLIYSSYALEFPESERKTFKQLEKLMSGGKYHLILSELVKDESNIQVGFAFVYHDDCDAFVWLDYLVMNRAYQGKGYGSVFFGQLLTLFNEAKYMYIEVEIPDGIDVNKSRRVQYYERLGSQRLPVNYALPIPGGQMPMLLYVKTSSVNVSSVNASSVNASSANVSSQMASSEVAANAIEEPVILDVCEAINKVFQYVHHDNPMAHDIYKNIVRQACS